MRIDGVTPSEADWRRYEAEWLEAEAPLRDGRCAARYRSLTATDQVALVIVVRERPGARFSNPVLRAVAAAGRRLMVAPLLDHREGNGVAYGALTSFVDTFGPGSRLSVPATWGGHKQRRLRIPTTLAHAAASISSTAAAPAARTAGAAANAMLSRRAGR